MPQPTTPSIYRDLAVEELAQHPVKLGFEFEFASRRAHRDVAEDLAGIFGRSEIGVTGGYNAHNHRGYDKWNITSDSSINSTNDATHKVELVSPILTPANYAEKVTAVFNYLTERRAVTGSSTGMHITVSHPNVTNELDRFNALKFGLFLDDIAMTQKFRGNLDNQYASSLIGRFAKASREDYNNNRIRRGDMSVPWSGDPEILFLLTTKEPRIRRALMDMDKYRSINLTKVSNHLVEVRSPGGDYIAAGAADAIETARKILSALVYACSPDAGDEEYQERFKALFHTRIKPRPRPTVHNSPASMSFTVPTFDGFLVEVTFCTVSTNRDIDGWDIRQSRAVYVQQIKVTHALPSQERTAANSIFSPSTSGARSLSVNINFRAVCSNAGLLEENYEATRAGCSGPMVLIDSVSSNASEIRGVNQLTHASTILARIQELVGSPLFRTKLVFSAGRDLRESLTNDELIRRVCDLSVVNPGPNLTQRTDMTYQGYWNPVKAVIQNAIESHRRSAERSARIADPDNFSSVLTSRLAALRSAATAANANFTLASSTAGVAPIPDFMSTAASDVRTGATSTPAFNPREAFASSALGVAFYNAMSAEEPLERHTPAQGLLERTQDATRCLIAFGRTLDTNPRMISELMSRIAMSRVVARDLEQATLLVPSISSPDVLRALSVSDRQDVLNELLLVGYLSKVLTTQINSSDLGTLEGRRKLGSFFELMTQRVGHSLATFEGLRGQVGLVHSPVRLAISIRYISTTLGVNHESILSVFVSTYGSIFRSTHVGRVRAALTETASATAVENPAGEIMLTHL
jgi:hypothetical protein